MIPDTTTRILGRDVESRLIVFEAQRTLEDTLMGFENGAHVKLSQLKPAYRFLGSEINPVIPQEVVWWLLKDERPQFPEWVNKLFKVLKMLNLFNFTKSSQKSSHTELPNDPANELKEEIGLSWEQHQEETKNEHLNKVSPNAQSNLEELRRQIKVVWKIINGVQSVKITVTTNEFSHRVKRNQVDETHGIMANGKDAQLELPQDGPIDKTQLKCDFFFNFLSEVIELLSLDRNGVDLVKGVKICGWLDSIIPSSRPVSLFFKLDRPFTHPCGTQSTHIVLVQSWTPPERGSPGDLIRCVGIQYFGGVDGNDETGYRNFGYYAGPANFFIVEGKGDRQMNGIRTTFSHYYGESKGGELREFVKASNRFGEELFKLMRLTPQKVPADHPSQMKILPRIEIEGDDKERGR